MDYIKQLNDFRNGLHREIVQEGTSRNCEKNGFRKGVLQLEGPIIFGDLVIGGICTETGLLVSTDNQTIIPYQNLSIDDLHVLYQYVVLGKKYSFTPDKQLV